MRPILAEAVDLARRALLELQPSGVGDHLGVTAEDDCAATHHFEATLPGYRGWQWAVVVAAPPEAEYATVSESALLPGPDALVAPEFVPWERRIRPGDLAPGDLLAPAPDDPRLVPGYLMTGDPVVDEVAEEIGLGRPQVLSREGRVEAAERWYAEYGPDTDMARAAPSTCGVCGFFVPLAGSLRAAFGVCANAMGADGHVVHVEYGCGAHSDTVVPTGGGSPIYEAYDDAAVELIPTTDLRKPHPEADNPPTEPEPAATETTATATEPTTDEPKTAAPDSDSPADSVSAAEADEAVESQATAAETPAVAGKDAAEGSEAVARESESPAGSESAAVADEAVESGATAAETTAVAGENAAEGSEAVARESESPAGSVSAAVADEAVESGAATAETPAEVGEPAAEGSEAVARESESPAGSVSAALADDSDAVASGSESPVGSASDQAAESGEAAAETVVAGEAERDGTAIDTASQEVSGVGAPVAEVASEQSEEQAADASESAAAVDSGASSSVSDAHGETVETAEANESDAAEQVGDSRDPDADAVPGTAGETVPGNTVSGRSPIETAGSVEAAEPADGGSEGVTTEAEHGSEVVVRPEAAGDDSAESDAAAAETVSSDSASGEDADDRGVSEAEPEAGAHYSDAWAVSAVRVKHGESGASEPN
ncbi:DUF3027 domain-containing protein [Nocardia transvalensis]|nr:DUF3027 domain-containing protein [Nocardia transvalensis]